MSPPPLGSPSIGPAFSGTIVRPALAYALTSVLATISVSFPPSALAGPSSEFPRTGVPGMREPDRGSLLVVYYESFLRDHDIERFRQQVAARFTEGTLARLVKTGDGTSRRAGVLALGLIGSIESNGILARALRDSDAAVRDLADHALW